MNTLLDPVSRTNILERLDGLKETSRPLWGKMTAAQTLCHLSDPLRDILHVRNTKPVTPSFFRPLLRWMLLGKKPFGKNAPTVKPYLQSAKGGGTKPGNFGADKEELKSLVNRFSTLDDRFLPGAHAALGQLNKEQAGLFMWKHLDHHLRQFGL